ncbi:MAG: hypothetical protein IT210_16160 [Armatimonadetes bacterium]|nr:hypothetical protein [Armatimonadota bacterium]
MKKRILPAVILLAVLVPATVMMLGQRGKKVDAQKWEEKLGYHLYAPTVLPRGLRPGPSGTQQGAHRVVSDYMRGDVALIVAQEKRNPERDAYNKKQFFDRGEKTSVEGWEAVLCKDSLGGRQIVCQKDDALVIVRSSQLTDEELVAVAGSLK